MIQYIGCTSNRMQQYVKNVSHSVPSPFKVHALFHLDWCGTCWNTVMQNIVLNMLCILPNLSHFGEIYHNSGKVLMELQGAAQEQTEVL